MYLTCPQYICMPHFVTAQNFLASISPVIMARRSSSASPSSSTPSSSANSIGGRSASVTRTPSSGSAVAGETATGGGVPALPGSLTASSGTTGAEEAAFSGLLTAAFLRLLLTSLYSPMRAISTTMTILAISTFLRKFAQK